MNAFTVIQARLKQCGFETSGFEFRFELPALEADKSGRDLIVFAFDFHCPCGRTIREHVQLFRYQFEGDCYEAIALIRRDLLQHVREEAAREAARA